MKIRATFQFKPFSRRQKVVLAWWCDGSAYKDYDGIIADGAIRSGKTIAMSLSFCIWAMSSFNGTNFGMCGKTIGSFRRNVLFWLRIMIKARGYKSQYSRTDNLLIIRQGTTENYFYIFGGRDERSQDLIQGITLAGLFCDEVALMPESFVNQATGRCSVEGSKFWFNCNPEGPEHWFRKKWILQHKEKRLLYLHFTMDDNLSLSETIKARYRAMYSGLFYDRFIRGLWVQAEGLVYPMFKRALHVVPAVERDYTRYVLSCDYGIQNPFSVGLWGLCDDVWYRVREYYHSGRDSHEQKTDQQYYDEICAFVGEIKPEFLIIDPSAASFITLCRQQQRFRIRKARNDVLPGIQATAAALNLGLIKICDCCEAAISEFGQYAWAEKAKEDTVIKDHDHAMDDIRYFVFTMRIGQMKAEDYKSPFGG